MGGEVDRMKGVEGWVRVLSFFSIRFVSGMSVT